SVTAANHLVGELTALVVLHHALGGDQLDGLRLKEGGKKKGGKDKSEGEEFELVQPILEATHKQAASVGSDLPGFLQPQASHFTEVEEELGVGGAIGDARVRLKKVMILAYVVHPAGGTLWKLREIPVIGTAAAAEGLVMSGVAVGVEWKVYQELLVLKALEA